MSVSALTVGLCNFGDLCEIYGSHNYVSVDSRLFEYDALSIGKNLPPSGGSCRLHLQGVWSRITVNAL